MTSDPDSDMQSPEASPATSPAPPPERDDREPAPAGGGAMPSGPQGDEVDPGVG